MNTTHNGHILICCSFCAKPKIHNAKYLYLRSGAKVCLYILDEKRRNRGVLQLAESRANLTVGTLVGPVLREMGGRVFRERRLFFETENPAFAFF